MTMNGRAVTRKSLPLTQRDLEAIETLRGSTEKWAALHSLAGAEYVADTDAAVLHALVEIGLAAVAAHSEEAGYAQLAAERNAAQRQQLARRRRPSWADAG